MRFLAEARSPAGIGSLRKHWLFVRQDQWHDSLADSVALAALANIGAPALPALADIAAEGYKGRTMYYPVSLILRAMPQRLVVAGALEAVVELEDDADRRRRLGKIAADVRRKAGRGEALAISPAKAGGLADPLAARTKDALTHCRASVEELSAWLLSLDPVPKDQHAVAAEAMLLLGRFRSPDAVPALRRHAYFDRDAVAQGPEDLTALVALAQIGLPALPALADIGADAAAGTVEDALVAVLQSMAPPEAIAAYVEDVADREMDPDRYARLKGLASSIRLAADRRR